MEKINIFMDWIYNKPVSKNWLTKYNYNNKFKAFIKEARKTVPDFITLCHIVNFIRLLKVTYYYRFDKNDRLHILNDIVTDEDNFGFSITKNDYIIEIKMAKPTHRITIRVLDTMESKSRSEFSKIEFAEGTLKIESPIQQLQYTHLNWLIMDSISNLLEYYYNYHTEEKYNG